MMEGHPNAALPIAARGDRGEVWVEAAAPFAIAVASSTLLAIDGGGYAATTWGWAALALAWVGGLALVLRQGRVSRLELCWIGGLIALTAWTAASMLWTSTQTGTALEVERSLVYVLAAIAVTAIARSFAYRGLLWGTWAGSTLACSYALATRLFPQRLGVFDPIAGYRLSDPIGYWNGLGLLAAIAILLSAGLATCGRPGWARTLAAACVPLLLPTLYFTFSRGAWVSLAAALIAAFVLSQRRLQLASSLLVQAVPAAAAVWLAYQEKPLRETNARLAAATLAGHTLAWRLLLLAVGAAALRLAYDAIERRVHVATWVRRGFATTLITALLVVIFAGVIHYGGFSGVVDRARRSIDTGTTPAGGHDLSQRLFSLSSNGRLHQWHVALDEWHTHPLLGGGAGSFYQFWAAAGPDQPQLLDVHNLYLETLAELGPIGLAILGITLSVPLAAAVRARRHSLVPIAAAGYAAWLVHVTYDWDWELPGVTIAAVLCASAVLVAARRQGCIAPRGPTRWALLGVTSVVGAAAALGLLGNRALARSADALHAADYSTAVAAADDARRWQPWSSAPWAQLALIHRLEGRPTAERADYTHAIEQDSHNWELWLGLASVSRGPEYKRALRQLSLLSPAAAAGMRRKP